MKAAKMIVLAGLLWPALASAQLGEAPLPQVAAQANPATLEETQRWLETKINAQGYYTDPPVTGSPTESYHRWEIFFDGCQYTLALIMGYKEAADDVRVWYGSLSNLTGQVGRRLIGTAGPDAITVGGDVYTREMGFSREQEIALKDGDRVLLGSVLDRIRKDGARPGDGTLLFGAADEVMEQRIANAFTHAANLCRAQDKAKRDAELAKSTKPANEPF
jgi:hypothetical protein